MLETLRAALEATGYSFAHFGWAKEAMERKRDHGVYAEDGANDFEAGNHHTERAVQGTVDYFTRDDSGAPQAIIEAALDSCGCAWYLNSVQFEQDTGFIHYEWVFEVV